MIPLDLTADREGERLDAFLARSVPDLTRSAAQRLLERGAVTLRGRAAKKNDKTRLGDTLTVCLLYHCGTSLSGINGELRPGIVHRIDRDTSGLIVAAKNDRAHLALAAQLQDHSLARVYEAVAVGGFREDCGTVDAPIGRHPVDRKKMAVDRKNGREAVTHWSVLARYPGYTHVECRLETGRTHQIRVHLASIGHPLLGATVYGSKKPWPGLAGQCLHARRLRFVHPSTGEPLELECPLPDWFRDVLEKLEH